MILIVGAFGQALEQPLPVQHVAPGTPIPSLPDIVPPMLAGMETYDSIIPMQETARTFGVTQTSLAAFVRQMLNLPAS